MVKLLPLILGTTLILGCEVAGTNDVHIQAMGLNHIPTVSIDLSQMPESSYTLRQTQNDKGFTSLKKHTSITLKQPARIIIVPVEK